MNFGENAGKIWETLNEKGPLTKDRLMEITMLDESEFHTGLGWLARENKICKGRDGNYRLDNTNLTIEVGKNAGRVFKVMDIWGEVDVTTLRKLVDVDEEEVYSALGWLAKENKICADNKLERFELK